MIVPFGQDAAQMQLTATLHELESCNRVTERYGLCLSTRDAQALVTGRLDALETTERVEFGGGVARESYWHLWFARTCRRPPSSRPSSISKTCSITSRTSRSSKSRRRVDRDHAVSLRRCGSRGPGVPVRDPPRRAVSRCSRASFADAVTSLATRLPDDGEWAGPVTHPGGTARVGRMRRGGADDENGQRLSSCRRI